MDFTNTLLTSKDASKVIHAGLNTGRYTHSALGDEPLEISVIGHFYDEKTDDVFTDVLNAPVTALEEISCEQLIELQLLDMEMKHKVTGKKPIGGAITLLSGEEVREYILIK